MLIFEGVVDSGQHLAGPWARHDALIATLLGVPLHPGSINVFVSATEHPEFLGCKHPFFRRDVDEPVEPSRIRQQGFLLVRECDLNGQAAFILRTESPGKAYDGPNREIPTRLAQPNTMFEIVAPFLPGIEYGVRATIAFDPAPHKLRKIDVR
jgi:hypothetical protein